MPTVHDDTQVVLVGLLQVERATASIIISRLVRKGLIEQVSDAVDQRQKSLHITSAGAALWRDLPDLGFIHDAAFAGFSDADLETTMRVLKAATEHLNRRLEGKTGMTILLTGATGLVGERLLPRLIETGENCRILVRPGKTGPATVAAVEGDLFDPPSLNNAVTGVSAIIHLAAVFRTQDQDLIWKSNLEGTRCLIAAAQAHAPQVRFVMASTSNVYNRNNPQPGRETDTVEPEQAYPASKVAAERLLRDSGLNWSILRFPFVYGDGDCHLEMLPKHLATFGFHPANRMSTIHHRDIAKAMKLALAGAFDAQIVNISDEAPTTIYELVELVGGKMKASAEPMQNPWHLYVDASLARSLGFQATVRTVNQAAQLGIL